MTIRPTVNVRTFPRSQVDVPANWEELAGQRKRIKEVLASLGITDYWLSLVEGVGTLNVHGGERTWLIELPGPHDFVALPVGLSPRYCNSRRP